MIAEQETIVIIHGFCGHRWIMQRLCGRLRRRRYNVLNWGYRSLWQDMTRHASRFRSVFEKIEADPNVKKFHVVAHSMGSIVARVVLGDYRPVKLDRIVMLCPPNHGAHAASRVEPFFGWISTTLSEITDRPDSFVNSLSIPIDSRYEIGIIKAQTDLVVASESTQLDEAKEYAQAPGFHTSILFRPKTAELVNTFLQTGSFEKIC